MATIDEPKFVDRPTLFIDRCAWSRRLAEALDGANIPYVPHHRYFAHDTADEEWLAAVKHHDWLILTRDKRIRYRINEARALIDAKLLTFVLSQGGLSAAETGLIVCAAYPAITRLAASAKPPAMFSITRSGAVSKLKLDA